MKMTKKVVCQSLALAVMAIMGSACSSDDEVKGKVSEVEVSGDQATIAFTIVPETFQTPNNFARSLGANTMKTIDLGDGLLADVSIEAQETSVPESASRASAVSDGTYSIYAIDATTNTRVTGADAIVTGTVSGGKFTANTGSKLVLTPGTYHFVCYNGEVTDNTTSLSIPAGDKNSMIGVVQNVTVSGTAQGVTIEMKHQTARVRLKLIAYVDATSGVTASLNGTDYTRTYNIDGTDNAQITATSTQTYSLATTPSGKHAKYVLADEYYTDYVYIAPDYTTGNALTVSFTGGSLYGEALAGKTLDLRTLGISSLQKNDSYTVNVKLRYVPLYLFQDGTVGAWSDRGSRTAIGIVASEKTNTEVGRAMGLKVGKDLANPANYWEDVSVTGDPEGTQKNTTVYAGLHDGLQDMNGYNWTWDASSTTDGVVRANEPAKYPAFYWAGHYNPGVTVTGSISNWYLPAAGEVFQMFQFFDPTMTIPTIPTGWAGYSAMNSTAITKFINASTNAGGNFQWFTLGYFFWTSTTSAADNFYRPITLNISYNEIWWPTISKNGANVYPIAFTQY